MSELLPRPLSCRRPREGGDLSQHFADGPPSAGLPRGSHGGHPREGRGLFGALAAIAALATAICAPGSSQRPAPGGNSRPATRARRGDGP